MELVKDINPTGDARPNEFAELDWGVMFFADDGINDRQLWRSDGTADGTQLVKIINPIGYSSPSGFVELNGKLYFSADDGTNDRQLWETDGTEKGTKLTKIINPSGNSNPENFKEYGGKLYFAARTDNTAGMELYETDGTAEGTRVISPDIAPNLDPLNISVPTHMGRFFEINNGLCFTANYTSLGQELYKLTDPTLSIDKQPELVKFKAYPNPTTDKLIITTEKYSSFSLLDITGKVLMTFDVNQQKEISTTELASGVYLLKENTTGAHTKIIKQ